jgi:hypothetical protein
MRDQTGEADKIRKKTGVPEANAKGTTKITPLHPLIEIDLTEMIFDKNKIKKIKPKQDQTKNATLQVVFLVALNLENMSRHF